MPVTVSLAEHNRELRDRFAALLNGTSGLSCLAACGTAGQLLQLTPLQLPDVVLVDLNLSGGTGIDCLAKLKALSPDLEVLMLALHEQDACLFDSICAGASGYLLKRLPATEFIQAIKQIHAGRASMTMSIARNMINYYREIERPGSARLKLTQREQAILELLAKGGNHHETGDAFGISLSTVQAHLHSIYRKLHVNSGSQAVKKPHDCGVVSSPADTNPSRLIYPI